VISSGQEGVRGNGAGEPVAMLGDQPQADETTPVLTEQRRVSKIDRGDARRHGVDVTLVRVVLASSRLVGSTEADEIGRDRSKPCGDDARNDLAIQERPRRLAMEHQHDRCVTRSFIDEVNSHARIPKRNLGVPRRERKQRREGGKALVWRSQHVHPGVSRC